MKGLGGWDGGLSVGMKGSGVGMMGSGGWDEGLCGEVRMKRKIPKWIREWSLLQECHILWDLTYANSSIHIWGGVMLGWERGRVNGEIKDINLLFPSVILSSCISVILSTILSPQLLKSSSCNKVLLIIWTQKKIKQNCENNQASCNTWEYYNCVE